MKFIPAFVLGTVMLSGCADVPLEKQAITIQDDQYSKNVTLIGKALSDNPYLGIYKGWFIRSFVNKTTGDTQHQLYIRTQYQGDWHFFQNAADNVADELPFVSIDQSVGDCQDGCVLNEIFALTLSDTLLHDRASSGFSVKVSAKDGTAFVIPILAGQIQPQLNAVNNYKIAHGLARQ